MLSFSALLASFGGFLYVLGAVLVALVALLIIGVVLIQDSKEGGLGGAFGSGMGSEMLGARGQKDIARFTSILGVIFAVLVVALGVADSSSAKESRLRAGDEGTRTSLPEESEGSVERADAPAVESLDAAEDGESDPIGPGAGAGAGISPPSGPPGLPVGTDGSP